MKISFPIYQGRRGVKLVVPAEITPPPSIARPTPSSTLLAPPPRPRSTVAPPQLCPKTLDLRLRCLHSGKTLEKPLHVPPAVSPEPLALTVLPLSAGGSLDRSDPRFFRLLLSTSRSSCRRETEGDTGRGKSMSSEQLAEARSSSSEQKAER